MVLIANSVGLIVKRDVGRADLKALFDSFEWIYNDIFLLIFIYW